MAKGGKQDKEEFVDVNFPNILKIFKINWNWIILILILLFAVNIRIYHVDYPVISYHAWKETHYLTEARNFAKEGFFSHGFFVPEVDYTGFGKDPSGAHSDTFPLTSIIVGCFFMLFGPKLWIARLLMILFDLGGIVMLYLIMRKLFKREDLALLVAFLASISPLLVVFGAKVMLQSPGGFLMLASVYCFLKFIESDKPLHLIYTMIFLVTASITEYPFAIIVIPMLILFPWKRLKNIKKYLIAILVSALLIAFAVFWFVYSNYYIADLTGTKTVSSGTVDYSLVFTSSFWGGQSSYIADNFTTVGFVFAIIGIIFSIISFKRKSIGYKFIMAYLAASLIFTVIMANKLKGHSYHWYPITPFIIMMIGFFIFWIAHNAGKLFSSMVESKKAKTALLYVIEIAIMLGFLFILWKPSFAAMDRMWDTQFYGLDVAGQYIKENSQPDERLIHSDEQSYAVVWSADRKGYAPPKNVSDLQVLEDHENVKWILMYQWGMSTFRQNTELWNYIIAHYSLKQVAFFQQGQQTQVVYFLFNKGGSYNESQLNDMVKGKQPLSAIYDTKTQGKVTLNYFNI